MADAPRDDIPRVAPPRVDVIFPDAPEFGVAAAPVGAARVARDAVARVVARAGADASSDTAGTARDIDVELFAVDGTARDGVAVSANTVDAKHANANKHAVFRIIT